ncbi:MAG: VCBS repeat-containing protein [Planctomycetota bacterium]|nr:VCBS repeat-containing protein [Planctomycetota bacterium]
MSSKFRARYWIPALIVVMAVSILWYATAEGALRYQELEIPEGHMELIDLDGDELNDIVVYTYTAILIYWHHPGQGFKRLPDHTIQNAWASEFTQDFTITDINADGLMDVFHINDGAVEVYFQKQGRSFPKKPDSSIEFPENIWLVDLGDMLPSKGLEVVTMGRDGVVAWPIAPEADFDAPFRLTDKTLFLSKIENEIHARKWPCPWNFCIDADGDGDDDLFVPSMKSILLFIQEPAGEFLDPIELDTPVITEFSPGPNYNRSMKPLMDSRSTSLWTGLQAPSISCYDADGDGRRDIVLDRHFAYLQDENGKYPHTSELRAEDIPRERPESPMRDETFDEYCDVNGDGITDRVYQRRPWSTGAMKSEVKVYFGDGKRDLYSIDPEKELPDTKKVGGNFLFEAPLVDLNGDGALDLLMFDTEYKITEVANWVEINRGNIDGEVEVTFFDKERNRFPSRVHFRKKLSINYAIRTYEIFQGRIFDYVRTMISPYYDFNGDGKKDLLVRVKSEDGKDTLYVYKNRGHEREIFSERPMVIHTPTFHHFKIMDVNSDGINDFILYDGADRRVGILMSYESAGL